jgi:transcriptional regulator with XRE-family HTH domain
MDTLASRLAQARNDRGLSQPELAKLAKVAQGTIGNIESGKRMGGPSLPAIARALNISYWWLRDGAGEMELSAQAWPFSAELWERISELEPDALRRAENQLRAYLDMEPLARPTVADSGKQDPLAA